MTPLTALSFRSADAGDPTPLLTPQPSAPGAGSGGVSVPPNRGTTGVTPTDLTQFAPAHWSVGEWIGYSTLIVIALGLTAIAVTTLWWMLHAWHSRASLGDTAFSQHPLDPTHFVTLLVPGRHEEAVMGATLDKLAEQDHPNFEIIAIVGDDDPGTAAVAHAAAARHPGLISVVTDASVPKNKPKALNTALNFARGDVIGVFDAEDDVHPRLLSLVDSRFTETDADVVQGGVQLMNFRSGWWALRNVLEYYFWFRSRLHFHAQSRFIPLGGNTVFVRRTWLDWSGGWDAECLAEDCELGVRLSAAGAKVVVAYTPEYVTREETPGSLTSLFKQRTRWNQGFLQVLGKGEWRRLPRLSQRLFARYLLAMPFLQAVTGLLIPASIVLALTVKVPTVVALITFIPLAPTIVTVCVETVGLLEFGRLYGPRARALDVLRLVLGTFPYQVFLAVAAIRSVLRQARGETGWEKTSHSGLHRPADTDADAGASAGADADARTGTAAGAAGAAGAGAAADTSPGHAPATPSRELVSSAETDRDLVSGANR